MQMVKLRYGNTNTFLLCGDTANLLVDTDYAGTLPAFYKAIKQQGIAVQDITYVMTTHYHPDHMGIIGDLMEHGVKLLLMDTQVAFVHFPDAIFGREKHLPYTPIDERQATVIRCADGREFLLSLGIHGEIVSTPSHSADSVSVILDDGTCVIGDLEPIEYLGAYGENPALETDWACILAYQPKRILYAHVNEKEMNPDGGNR